MKDIPNAGPLPTGRRKRGVYVSGHGCETFYRRPSQLPEQSLEHNVLVDAKASAKRQGWLRRRLAAAAPGSRAQRRYAARLQ